MINRANLFFVIGISISIITVITYLLWPASSASREVPPETVCIRNLKEIYAMIISYKNVNGHYPAEITFDPAGRELTWRVILVKRHIDTRDVALLSRRWVKNPPFRRYLQVLHSSVDFCKKVRLSSLPKSCHLTQISRSLKRKAFISKDFSPHTPQPTGFSRW